jgi:exonuclease SbcC
MKPVRLRVKGFGPYVEEQEIDFRSLKDAALYLITGPTGAGKTTLLDAICFGLYGDTSGGSRDGRQMRSDYLHPSEITEIVFDFDIGPESYRVKRSPAQVRLKLRGNGTTDEQATATLWRRTGATDPNSDGEVVACQPTKVTEAVTKLLGFECNQFRQVILLPQGEFRKFLSASSREREQILEVLFQTETFRQIEEVLKSKAKSIEEEIRDARQRSDTFLEAAGAESELELQQRKETAQQRSREVNGQLATARRVEANAQKAVDVARDTAAKLDELAAAEAALDAVQSKQTAIDAIRKEVTAARKSEQLLDMERSVQERVREHAEAEAALQTLKIERAKGEQANILAREHLASEERRHEERAEADREVRFLCGLRERVENLTLAATELEGTRKQHEREVVECDRLGSEARSLERTIAEREERLADLRVSAQRVDVLSLNEKRLDVALQNRLLLNQVKSELVAARCQFDEADTRFRQTKNSFEAAQVNLDQAQGDWISAQSSILAGNLSPGCP